MNRSAKLLYIEDDDLDRRAFLRLVREKGLPWEVTLAETLAAARAQLAASPFDLIVADYHLPDGDSTELFDEVPDMPFVLLTGTLEEQLALRTLERGADDYLAKDPERRHLEALPFTVEKTLYRERIRDRERRLARELRESEERFRLLVEGVKDYAIFMLDPKGRIVTWNSGAQRIKGYTAGEILGQPFSRLYAPEEAAAGKPQNELAIAVQAGQYRDEGWRLRKDGSRFWASVTITALCDPAGVLQGFAEVVQDLTERKRADESLRQSEEQFRALVTASSEALYRMSPDWSEMHQLHGGGFIANTEAPSRTWLQDYIPPDDQAHVMAAIHEAIRTKSMFELEHRVLRVDGSVGWTFSRAIPLLDASGDIVEWFGAASDVTARKQAEEALHQSEEKFRTLAENAQAGFGIIQGTRFVYANPYLARVSEYSVSELLSIEFSQVVHPDFRPMMVERARRRQAGEPVPNHYEFMLLTKSGQTRWLDFSAGTILYKGKPAIIGSGFDITEQKRAVESLQASRQQLQDVNLHLEQRVAERTAEAERRAEQLRELASELTRAEQRERSRVAGILHDHLQQLLVGAKFGSSTLRGQLTDESQRRALQKVDDLLSESLETSRNLTMELSPPILREGTLTAALHWLAGWMHDKHGLQVHLKLDETVNPPDEGVRILLFESVRELLFNIVKHAGTDSACATLERHNGAHLRIIVADAGAGFDSGQHRRHDRSSHGFGLFSIRERLGLIGGRFEIDSSPGQGARMTLVAPLRLLATEAVAEAAALSPAGEQGSISLPEMQEELAGRPATPWLSGRIRVLVADDHAVVRDGLAQLLQMHADVEVVGLAGDGQQAIELAVSLRPDVILMDVSMPQLNGVDATRRVRSELPQVCVIGLSMHAEDEMASRMQEAGAVSYLTKTAPPDAVVATIRGCAHKSPDKPCMQ